ncbi:uncharacterized protein LOC141857068 [Brevipalpus obovatus]|uniref:uncharacterized protein LOC141857068 n=1 Tax=Brevipalpus obovatus TaxID=246614 RepID=UPI003D9DEC59
MDSSRRRSSVERSTLEGRIRLFESTRESMANAAENDENPNSSKDKRLKELEEKVRKLESERDDYKEKLQKVEKEVKEHRLGSPGDNRSSDSSVKSRLKSLEKNSTDNRDLPGSPISRLNSGREDKSDGSLTTMKAKLKASEKLVADLTSENQEIKKEVKLLAQELEELHDTFREDQVSEFRHMKRELEGNAKNIRVLQFKLKKSERLNEQYENEKSSLEKKLAEIVETNKVPYDKKRMRDLENELSIAKEVSLKLHNEVSGLKEEKKQMETELMELKKQGKKVIKSDTCRPVNRGDKDSDADGGNNMYSISNINEKDQEELIRSLYDTMEREKDLQEQLRFAEEESRTVRRKLSTLEQENEILMVQIKKMANKANLKSGDKKNESEDLNADEMKLHIELYEQEMSVLRKKSDELQQENENLQHEVKYLQEKLVSQPMAKIEIPQIPPGSPSNVIYEHKIRILESEARELRRKLVNREKENESLRTELDVHRRKASKVMVRSRSLEGESTVDLKRQLQLVEQEANILRQKIMSLEAENEKITSENRRLQLRVCRRPPPGPLEELQIENMELKERISRLEKQEDSHSSSVPSSDLALLISSSEKDIINSLKKQIKEMGEDKVQLNRKVTELDLELSKVSMDNRKLRECLNYKKTPMRVVKESATRLELREIVHQMEEEISKLQATLNAKDIHNESLREELSESKKSLELAQIELRSRQTNEMIQEAKEVKEKCSQLESQLEMLSKSKGATDLTRKLISIEKERANLLTKIANVESEAISDRSMVRDLQEKVNTLTRENGSLADQVKSMEIQRNNLSKEVNDLQHKIRTTEVIVDKIKRELDDKTMQLESLQVEKKMIRKQLDDERFSSNFTVSLKSKSPTSLGNSSLSSNHEGLIKQVSDLENRNSNLERQLNEILKENKQRETSVRKEHEKQLQSVQEELRNVRRHLNTVLGEDESLKSKVTNLNQQVEKLKNDLKEVTDKYRLLSNQTRKEKEDLLSKLSDQEAQIRAEQRHRDKSDRDNELALKSKDESLLQARERIFRLEREMKRLEILLDQEKRDHGIVVANYDRQTSKLRQEYDDLTTRYEMLEQEFVATKTKALKEKDDLMSSLNSMRRSVDEDRREATKLRETYSQKQEEWIREKIDLQERLSESEARARKGLDGDYERTKLRSVVSDKDRKLDEYARNERDMKREIDRLKERCDDKSRQMVDGGRGSITSSDSVIKEVQYMKNKMDHAETSHRGEVAALRAEYEARMKLMRDEITILLTERDHLRTRIHMNNMNASHKDEMEDMRAAMETLRAHLEQALLENRNLKIEHASERSSWQIQVAELKTRLNQADEQTLMEMSRGSTRSYTKTRLELAWEKERQEQQKLLAETQKLVEEMKNRAVSLEIAREKERSEARKQLQEMKVLMDKEQEDTQKRIGELQLDLIDLRDSYARIRSQNDRLKRERLASEKEREEFRLRIFAVISIENKVNDLMEQISQILKMIPEVGDNNESKSTDSNDPTKRVRTRVRNRPLSETPEMNVKELRKLLEDAKSKAEEISRILSSKDSDDPIHRSISFRRAISSSDMVPGTSFALTLLRGERGGLMDGRRGPSVRVPPRSKSMAKKSLSLDHNMTAHSSYEQIWDSGDDSVQTTPGSSVSNLKYPPIYAHRRPEHSSISGYESDSSWRWTRESSYGSDVSAPAVMNSDHHHRRDHSSSSATSRPRKSFFRLLKKTHSIDNNAIASGSDADGKHKDQEKKVKSLRSRISKTLWKTLSPSSSNLNKESKEDKHSDSSGLRSMTSRDASSSSSSAARRTLSPTRVKPPSGYEAPSGSRLTPGAANRSNVDLGSARQGLRSANTQSKSTRV